MTLAIEAAKIVKKGLQFAWPLQVRAAVSLCWDGPIPSEALSLLKELGVRATFYVDPNEIGDAAESWRKTYLAGHEIGCLGAQLDREPETGQLRNLDGCTLEDLDYGLARGSDEIHRLVGVRPQTFAYPDERTFVGRDETQKSYVPLIEDRFLAGRCQRGERSNDPSSCTLAQLGWVSLDEGAFPRWRALVDDTIERGGWLVFAGRAGALANGRLAELCCYLIDRERAIWLDTVEAIAAHLAH